ncbi:10278_t:CDS:1, partial [Paraglomus occultum]
PFFSKPIGKAVLAVSLLILTMFILIALFWCYRSRSKRKDKNHKTRGIPASMSKSRVTPAPSQPSILTESKAPEPFLEPEMMTPISPSSGNQFDNASTASAAQSSRQPKRSYTIYGTQGASTSNVELSGTSNTYYPIVQQHHFMSSEHEPWE